MTASVCIGYSCNYNVWEQHWLSTKTNVSWIKTVRYNDMQKTHTWTCSISPPSFRNSRNSPATTEAGEYLCLMSWFRSTQCAQAFAQGHKHTCSSTWYGTLISPHYRKNLLRVIKLPPNRQKFITRWENKGVFLKNVEVCSRCKAESTAELAERYEALSDRTKAN